jgi:hypothetical protein
MTLRSRSAHSRIASRTLTAILALVGACAAPAPVPSLAGDPGPGAIAHLPALAGDYFPIASENTGRTYHVYVRVPEGYDPATAAAYPVVYVLDGDSLWPILAANHLFLTYDDELPEAIVVGIAYGSFAPEINRRDVDFTPQGADVAPEQAGAPAFGRFLKDELLPLIETRYRTDPARRVLFGQSRGGSFVLYSAFSDPDLFWGRIVSNPAFTPGEETYYAGPATALRDDLKLVVTSGENDRPALRAGALKWDAA